MATRSRKNKAAKRPSTSRVTISRDSDNSGNFLDKIQSDLEKNQSYLNLILGALIVIVLGVLVFNYFNKPSEDSGDLGPSQQMVDEQGDVTKEGLPGKYTVKEGDTLFLIAQKYYDDGNLYSKIMTENNLTSDSIEVGQELIIPKDEEAVPSPEESAAASPTPEPSVTPKPEASVVPAPAGGKGAMTDSSWGDKIAGDSYTVVKGDWLSKIAGRAYGDIMQYEKIAKANNISNPNAIEVGTVLKIPRD